MQIVHFPNPLETQRNTIGLHWYQTALKGTQSTLWASFETVIAASNEKSDKDESYRVRKLSHCWNIKKPLAKS